MMGGVRRRIRCGGKPMTAVVLAGGRGRRMKAEKAGLAVGGRTLLEHVLAQIEPHFEEILVSVSTGQAPEVPAEIRLIADEVPNQGPIGGLLAGLKAARNDACAVIACDIPDIDIPMLRALARMAAGADIAVPVGPAGLYEPLFAVYRTGVVPEIVSLLGRGERSLLPLFDRCRTAVVRFDDAGRIRNLNTREDYGRYLRSIEGEKADRPEGRRRPRKKGRS